jgi:hypothetical protein
MSAPARYYVVVDGAVSGPHGVDALREMASVHAFSRDSLITSESAENWLPIHALPALSDLLFPAAPRLQLKNRVIVPTLDAIAPVSVEELLRENLAAEGRQPAPPVHSATQVRSPGRARRRDYLIAAFSCNAIGLAAFLLLPRTPYMVVPLLAYFVIINVGLYWVFYQVMDRY